MRTKKILVIPHFPGEEIRVREKEIALHLAEYYEVYYLYWRQPEDRNITERFKSLLSNIFQPTSFRKKGKIWYLRISCIPTPRAIAKIFNKISLSRLFRRISFDVVINASFLFPVKKEPHHRYFVDLVDLPVENWQDKLGTYMLKFYEEEVLKADKVFVVSESLGEIISEKFNCKTIFLPNGTNINFFRNVMKEDVSKLRTRLGLEGKEILGAVGNWGEWMNLPFLLKVFGEFKKGHKNAALVLVGPGPEVSKYKNEAIDDSVIFVGSVRPDNIEKYFLLFDLAILPNKKTLWQDVAFHIKLVEYTAARKMVVSTPLREVLNLGFPNVIAVEHDVEKWIDAIEKGLNITWNPDWDLLVEHFDWRNILECVVGWIEE
ncbi:MAG: glycosyltransferase [bacterium]|nr:glycosyltransferase [bacterium]